MTSPTTGLQKKLDMSDLTVGRAVERLSQITCRCNIMVFTRALRLTLGQRRFTDLIMCGQHHLMTSDMKRVVMSYQSTLDIVERLDHMHSREKENMNEAT